MKHTFVGPWCLTPSQQTEQRYVRMSAINIWETRRYPCARHARWTPETVYAGNLGASRVCCRKMAPRRIPRMNIALCSIHARLAQKQHKSAIELLDSLNELRMIAVEHTRVHPGVFR